MAHHNFNFEHGDILSHIGATWYVSYAYYLHCDPEHDNYRRVDTWRSRASKYDSNKNLERYFLQQISAMSPERLSMNTIGLSGEEVLRMAKEVLARL